MTYEYEYNSAGLPIEQKCYKNGVYEQTVYYTYEEIAGDELIFNDAVASSKTGVYNMKGIYMGENINSLPNGIYIIRTANGAKKVLKSQK